MKAIDRRNAPEPSNRAPKPSDELKIAVTFRRPIDRLGPTKLQTTLSTRSALSFVPDALEMDRGIHELNQRGFEMTQRGQLTVSVRGTRAQFEKVFGTKLSAVAMPKHQNYSQGSVYTPLPGAQWNPDTALMELIDDAYIQWPHIYMAAARTKTATRRSRTTRMRGRAVAANGSISSSPPALDYHHLRIPLDLVNLLNARQVHQAGTTGRGVCVAMIDSGFDHSHPFFTSRNLRSSVVLAPGASNRATDLNGHGTGESANIFSIAPDVTFVGVKLDNDQDENLGASVLEGFQEALRHNPQVISVSLGYDLCDRQTGMHFRQLPNSLVALQAEIQAAVAAGTVVVFSAGNGHVSFPGMMPEVISAGGTFVDADGTMQASDYASAFPSRIYPGRNIPDCCGLVGLQPHADYIALPIPANCAIDRDNAEHDGTAANDGWGVFSGTSAAAPQLAAVCALLLERNPGLTPSDIKSVIQRTARDVTQGKANPASDETGNGLRARSGTDSATGTGLVDAYAAWQQV